MYVNCVQHDDQNNRLRYNIRSAVFVNIFNFVYLIFLHNCFRKDFFFDSEYRNTSGFDIFSNTWT